VREFHGETGKFNNLYHVEISTGRIIHDGSREMLADWKAGARALC